MTTYPLHIICLQPAPQFIRVTVIGKERRVYVDIEPFQGLLWIIIYHSYWTLSICNPFTYLGNILNKERVHHTVAYIKSDNAHYHFPRVADPADPTLFSLDSLR